MRAGKIAAGVLLALVAFTGASRNLIPVIPANAGIQRLCFT